MGFGVWGLGFGVWGVGCGVWGVGCGVWGVGCGVWGLGFSKGLGCRVLGLSSFRESTQESRAEESRLFALRVLLSARDMFSGSQA